MRPERLLRLYPRAWRERYGAEMAAMLDGRELGIRDSGDLMAHCLAEWVRALPILWLVVPFAVSTLLTGVGRALRSTYGRPADASWVFQLAMIAMIAVWCLIGARAIPTYWRWLRAKTHRQLPEAEMLPASLARGALVVAVIVGVITPWFTNLPAEWWSVASNPAFSLFAIVPPIAWSRSFPFSPTVDFSKRPPTHPLGLG